MTLVMPVAAPPTRLERGLTRKYCHPLDQGGLCSTCWFIPDTDLKLQFCFRGGLKFVALCHRPDVTNLHCFTDSIYHLGPHDEPFAPSPHWQRTRVNDISDWTQVPHCLLVNGQWQQTTVDLTFLLQGLDADFLTC